MPIPEIMALVENGTAEDGRLLEDSGMFLALGCVSGDPLRSSGWWFSVVLGGGESRECSSQ